MWGIINELEKEIQQQKKQIEVIKDVRKILKQSNDTANKKKQSNK